jgi:hypothetical protein
VVWGKINPDESILRLSDEQIQKPFTVLEDLCTDFGLGQIRDSLSETLEICLTEDDIFHDADKRTQLISMFKTMERLVEAVFVWYGRGRTPVNEFEVSNSLLD